MSHISQQLHIWYLTKTIQSLQKYWNG